MSKADVVRKRNARKGKQKTLNPFEQQQTKQKFNILGRKQKSNVGTPGAARGKAELNRKRTIGVDLKNQNKTNKFYDRRITMKDGDSDLASLKKFASLKKKVTRHKSKYHLDSSSDDEASSDDEMFLTHKGRDISTIKNHYIASAQDDLNDEVDASAQRRMQEANFGGGERNGRLSAKTTREEAMNEMIKNAKIQKFERQQEAEETLEKITEMDEKWTHLKRDVLLAGEGFFTNKIEKQEWRPKDDADAAGMDEWMDLIEDLRHEKRIKPDKAISLKEKKSQERLAQELEAKKTRELIFEQPEDERRKKGSAEKVGDSVDAIYDPMEKRNTAEPIAFTMDGDIHEKYQSLKKNHGQIIEDQDSDHSENADSGDDTEENYDPASLLPPKRLATWLELDVTPAKVESWARACNQVPDGSRAKKLENLLLYSVQFVLNECEVSRSVKPLQDYYSILTELMTYSPETFVELICEKWDTLSDAVCPAIDADLTPLMRCYSAIGQKLSKEGDEEKQDLGYSDYAMILLTANSFHFNRFRGKLTTQIWRTLESILLDTPTDLSFKHEIIDVFLPLTKTRYWPAAIKCLEKSLDNKKTDILISKCALQWRELPCFNLLFTKFSNNKVVQDVAAQPKQIKAAKMQKDSVLKKKNAVQSIQMFEPKYEKANDPVYMKAAHLKPENKSLLLKRNLRKERRATEKELRQDTSFISRTKADKQRKLDDTRKAKVATIMGQLSNQEGDVRASKRARFKLKPI